MRHQFLCGCCTDLPEKINKDVCIKCGLIKRKCICKKTKFHFSGVIAPFWYKGKIKDSLLKFKFGNAVDYSDYFAAQMADAIKTKYYNIDFDSIVYVPMTKKQIITRGYNQCNVLANKISNHILLPIMHNALIKVKENKTQHNLIRTERFSNVRNVYAVNDIVKGKTLLLIDDIKSTGATLDECARQLLLSGADSVYCVVTLLNSGNDDINLEK